MIDLLFAHPIRAAVALVLGIVTAWWIWGRLGEAVADTAGKAKATAGNAASGAADMAKDAAKDASSTAGDAASGAVAVAASAAEKTKETVQDAVQTTVQTGANMPKIAAAVGDPDDLTKIKGVGPKLAETCQSLGVTRFDQISKWSAADIEEVDQYLKFKGRITRDNWVEQAKFLASGDTAGHKAKFG